MNTEGASSLPAAMDRPEASDEAWDRFVASSPNGAYPQLSAWAEVKRANGWLSRRLRPEEGGGVGAQILVRRLGGTPWAIGYAPRGPLAADRFTEVGIAAFTDRVRTLAGDARLSHVTVDPEVEAGDPVAEWLVSAGWRRASAIQPDRTRLVDLDRAEEAVWSDLRSKWRQYVQKARRNGVSIVETGMEGLADFYRIYVETARRAGFVHRAASAYEQTYRAFARSGQARLLLASLDGKPVATVMLLTCGRRVIEPYGGMTETGADSRANYLLKWEAIRSSRERGATIYDMWGLSHPGIEQFKQGFGGRDVRYVGTYELVANRPVRLAVGAIQRLRIVAARRSQGLDGRRVAPSDAG